MSEEAALARFPRYEEASRRAKELTRHFSAPPIPVLDIAEDNGADVRFDFFPNFKDKVSGLCDFQTGRIYVNAADSDERRRFTIAHELGHWVLHRDYFLQHPNKYRIFPRFAQPDYNDPFEREANRFAADLLVPDHLIKPVRGAAPSRLAAIFGVSKQMMEIRLKRVRR